MKITCINKIEYCCDEMKNSIKMGYILYNDESVYLYYFNQDRNYIDKEISFCPFCGERIMYVWTQ